MSTLVKTLVSIASLISIGLGIWHFTVPQVWKWYSYIDPKATELVVAVRAINVFFSLSLVLFGVINILLVFGERSGTYALVVVLAATSVLWITRVGMQLVYPQGTINPAVQYGMLAAFILAAMCYVISLILVAVRGTAV